jgi:hypothetical protein
MADFQPGALLRALVTARAHFYLIGGVMVQVYLADQATQDLDLLIDQADLDHIWAALAPFHPRLVGETEPPTRQQIGHLLFQGRVVQLETDAGDLDLFAEVPGLGSYRQAKRAVRKVRLFGVAVEGLTPEALLETKVSVGRPKDRAVIAGLRALVGRKP